MNMKNTTVTKDGKGLQKIRALLQDTRISMMATNLEKIPFSICPMTLQEMDKQGNLWFFTSKNSDHFRNIEKDNRVQLIFSNENEQQYLSIYGKAMHTIDDQRLDSLWNPMLKAWFSGKDDPNLALLCVNMESAYYWDSDQNSLVTLYQLAKAATTGQTAKIGEKGHVDLQNQ